MKKIISNILLLVFVLNTVHQLGIIAYYVYNKSYIEKHLCIQRNNPHSTCHGKCHLVKKLEEDAQQNEKKLPQIKKSIEVLYTCVCNWKINFSLPTTTYSEKNHFTSVINHYYKENHFSIFHPPLA